MLTLALYGLLAIVLIGGLYIVAARLLPAGEQIAPPVRDEPIWTLPPERALVAADVAEVRLPVALRGYRFAETDLLLDRLVEELQSRDEQIVRLGGTPPVGAGGGRLGAATPGDGALPPDEAAPSDGETSAEVVSGSQGAVSSPGGATSAEVVSGSQGAVSSPGGATSAEVASPSETAAPARAVSQPDDTSTPKHRAATPPAATANWLARKRASLAKAPPPDGAAPPAAGDPPRSRVRRWPSVAKAQPTRDRAPSADPTGPGADVEPTEAAARGGADNADEPGGHDG